MRQNMLLEVRWCCALPLALLPLAVFCMTPRFVSAQPAPDASPTTTHAERIKNIKEKSLAELSLPGLEGEHATSRLSELKDLAPAIVRELLPFLQTAPAAGHSPEIYQAKVVVRRVLNILQAYGPRAQAAVPAINRVLDTPEYDWARERAAQALPAIAPHDVTVVAALRRVLQDGSSSLVVESVKALTQMAPDVARVAMPDVVIALHAPHQLYQQMTIHEALGQFMLKQEKVPTVTQAVAILKRRQQLKNSADATLVAQSAAAFLVLHKARKEARVAVPVLANFLVAPNQDYLTGAAIRSIGFIGPGTTADITRTLLSYVAQTPANESGDYIGSLSGAAMAALQQATSADKAAVAPLTQALTHQNPWMRRTAAGALAGIGAAAAPATQFLARELSMARLPDSRKSGPMVFLRALRAIGPGAKAALPVMVDLLRPEARLWQMKETDHGQRALRANLLAAIAAIGAPQDVKLRRVALNRVLDCLGKTFNPREPLTMAAACRAIGVFGEDAEAAVPLLMRVLQADVWAPIWESDNEMHWGYVATTTPHLEAIRALERMGVAALPAVPLLRQIAARDDDKNRFRDTWGSASEVAAARQALQILETVKNGQPARATLRG